MCTMGPKPIENQIVSCHSKPTSFATDFSTLFFSYVFFGPFIWTCFSLFLFILYQALYFLS